MYYNKNAKDLPALAEGDSVRLKPFKLGDKVWKQGVVTQKLDNRSYEVATSDGGLYKWNRVHIRRTHEPPPDMSPNNEPTLVTSNQTPALQTPRKQAPTPPRNVQVPGTPPRYNNNPVNSPVRQQKSPQKTATQSELRSRRVTKKPAYLTDFVPK